MKCLNSIVAITVVLASIGAAAWQKPVEKMPVTESFELLIAGAQNQLSQAADAMPEDKFSFVPANGAFAGTRTYGQQIKHLAANNYRMAAFIVNQQPTPDQEAEKGPDSVQSKAQIMEYLQGSFAALRKSAATITESNLNEYLPIMVNRNSTHRTRLQLVIDAIVHDYDHYGQMVEYLRMNDIIPPASRKTKPQ